VQKRIEHPELSMLPFCSWREKAWTATYSSTVTTWTFYGGT
jgi:hypothetical protein